LIGSIPFGWIFVKLKNGKDIRDVQSGRTGGTNAMRAAGLPIGLYTAIFDIYKGTFAVQMAMTADENNFLLHVLAGVATIVGHNYSIFLLQRSPTGRWRLAGGAGGGTSLGGSIGLWSTSLWIILPIAILVFYFVGYASITTISVAVLSILIFGIGSLVRPETFPWQYTLFGVASLGLLLWALKRNIKALRAGTERLHGFRARKNKTPSEESKEN
ncbi:MAG: glycerol-3-phosphate acyltransferase, partial [Deltaproteobacteria bacterium]